MRLLLLVLLFVGCGADGGSNRTASDDFSIQIEPGASLTLEVQEGEVTIVEGNGVADVQEVENQSDGILTVGDSNEVSPSTEIGSTEQLEEDRQATCANCCGNNNDGIADDECLEINNCLPEDLVGTTCVLF